MTMLGLVSFAEMKQQARNAEEALLVAHSACANQTHTIGEFKWPDNKAAGRWLQRLWEQRQGLGGWIAPACLEHMELKDQTLESGHFAAAVLEGSDLSSTRLIAALFVRANLERVRLRGALLQWANLQEANLLEADLQGADLQEANLRGAHLPKANLRGADLKGQTS